MYEKPAGPLSIRGVVDDAFKLYRASFNRAWVPALIMQFLITGVLIYVRIESPELVDAEGLAFDVRKVAPSLLGLYLVAVIVSLIFSNAITAQLLAVRDARDLSIGGSIAIGASFFAPTLGLALLFGGAGGIITVVAGASLAVLPTVARGLLAVLCVLLALYLVGRVFLVTVPLMGERTGVMGAVRASWRVTRRYWLRAAAVMTVVLLLFATALIAMQLCAGLISLVVRSGTMAGLLAMQLVSVVIQAVAVPFFNAGFVSTFYDLKLRTDGAQLAVLGNP